MERAMKKRVVMAVNVVCLMMVCSAMESPGYTVVHSDSDFEIRLYRSSVWMSAPAVDISFEKATWNGFHRYQSIHFLQYHFQLINLLNQTQFQFQFHVWLADYSSSYKVRISISLESR